MISIMLKRNIKRRMALFSQCVSLPKGRRVVILCYHSVHPRKKFASASPELFREQMRFLSETCEVLGELQDALTASRMERSNAKPAVLVTFDDGYADNYEYAFPILEEYGIPATFFVTVGFVNNEVAAIERQQYLRNGATYDDIRPMTWSQIREMHRKSLHFGNHTRTHPNLIRLSRQQAQWECVRQEIEDQLGSAVTVFAYPFGKYRRHFSDETEAIVREAGYECAAAVSFRGVRPGEPAFRLPRFFVTREDDMTTFAEKIAGGWDWLGWWHELSPLWLARRISPEDFKV